MNFAPIGTLLMLAYALIPIAILWYVVFSATRAGVRAAMKETGPTS
ncbi:MAG TPA: hypothetical protein VMV52_02365 [Candidatus Nanopelagicaceae bacterium]|nr:hypothetical protein [Candidatus Nanopelagicaceae bacterium]